ncbi:MAG: NAD(P)-dependent oxidoreductase [Acutalibacteraceae bacterium]|nr:NAD(P)-dependent oxidoreductase [Acutalibacteraceae bacterium]
MHAELSKYATVEMVGLEERDLSGFDIFIGKKMTEKMLSSADKLKVVFAYKTGVDEFPLKAMKERGIYLVNSHIDADYIAEYSFGLSISLVNRITEFDKKLRRGIWYDEDNPYWKSFFDMKVGLVGYGSIGRHLHRLLLRNDMDVYTLDRGHEYRDITPLKTLEELCKVCDLLVLSLPKTEETNNIINKDILKLLKGKYIVNVGRSNCIDQEALYNALKNKEIGGVANDTWDMKPKNIREKMNPSQYDFCSLENIVISPHQAMRVDDGHDRYVEDTTNKVISYIKNGEMRDIVDLDKGY